MLLVKARVGPSSIHGLGLISAQPVAPGEVISHFAPGLDLTLSQEELDALPEVARATYRYYSFRHVHTERYVLSFDDDRFMNHANDPSTDGRHALRPIRPGDELTYDYRRWDLDCEWKLAGTPGAFAHTLADGPPPAQLAVLRIIARVGLQDTSAVPPLAALLHAPHRDLRYYAAKALTRLGPLAAPAVDPLGTALSDLDPQVRYYAAKALCRIGPPAAPAADQLTAAATRESPDIRDWCLRALEKLRPVQPGM